MKVETIDPWRFVRDNEKAFVNSVPRTRATLSLRPAAATRVAWTLFWHSLGAQLRRRRSIDFWLEDGS